MEEFRQVRANKHRERPTYSHQGDAHPHERNRTEGRRRA
jgi:hypothetical protein